jgi:glycerol uptake facilitator-like aquaporin
MANPNLGKRAVAEFLGSAFLAMVVIGSGIAAQRLSPGNAGLQLLENALATGLGLTAIIYMFGSVSGAHLNPAVSIADAWLGRVPWREVVIYVPSQVAGCIGGAILANVMFSEAAVSISSKHRASGAHFVSEIVATFGLLFLIFALVRTDRRTAIPAAVGAYIAGAYFFTSLTSFANPAITVGRMLSDSFAGIAPSSVPSFVLAQLVAIPLVVLAIWVFYPTPTRSEPAMEAA